MPIRQFIQPNTAQGAAAYYYARKHRLERVLRKDEPTLTEAGDKLVTEDDREIKTEK